MQQGKPSTQLTQVLPSFLSQETDIATPRTPIPIFYMHEGTVPFCTNPRCYCQRGKRAGAWLFQEIVAGQLRVVQVIQGIPQDCYYYGHSWQITEHPDVKECIVCHMRGYCPGCTPVAPAGAQPFHCTAHAGRTGQ